MGASIRSPQEFFGRLAALPFAPQVHAAFDRLFLRAPADLSGTVYRELVGHVLDWAHAPRSGGGLHWEWRPLLLLQAEVDPFYFTDAQIARRIAECPPLPGEQRAILQRAIGGLFTLRRNSDLTFPTGWVPQAFQRKWTALVPPELAWRSLEVLQAAGLCTLGTAGGFRSHARFTEGEFSPALKPERLVAWEQVCDAAEAQPATGAAVPPPAAPAHRAGFLAAAFAGELTALGLDGPCGATPRCDACMLRRDCAWASGEAANKVRGPEDVAEGTLARARLGRAESLSLPALLDGLLALEPEERERLRTRLKGQTLRSLSTKSALELEEWLGGASQAPALDPARLLLLFELCKRFGEERLQPGAAFTGAQDVFRHFQLRFRDLKQERFLVVLLDVKKRFLSETLVSQGGLDSSPVHAREVFAPAVRERAAYVLLVHNHPSGDPTPSAADLDTTRALANLGQVMGIPILDHVILGDERFVSVRESGLVDL